MTVCGVGGARLVWLIVCRIQSRLRRLGCESGQVGSEVIDKECGVERGSISLRHRFVCRRWPIAAAAVVLLVGMGYLLGWGPVVLHRSAWSSPPDVWEVWRGAHFVGWGDISGVYDPSSGIVAFAGMEILLAPFAMISGHFHLTESYSPVFLAHPTTALILQPVELIAACTLIFAADSLGQRLDVSSRRRGCLCLVNAVFALLLAALWGHAEDALAMTFAIYSLIAAFDERWARSAWLLGFGIAIQPLVLPLLPLLVAASPRGMRAKVVLASSALPVCLIVLAMAGGAADVYRAIVEQPAIPSLNHVTPWIAFAHVIGRWTSTSVHSSHGQLVASTSSGHVIVAGGLGRSIYSCSAVLVGLYLWRRPQTRLTLLWLAAAVLAGRCFFEAVMCPYYLVPPIVITLVLAAGRPRLRFEAALGVAAGVIAYSYFHFSPWVWWLPLVAGLVVMLALSYLGLGAKELSSLGPTEDEGSLVPGQDRPDRVMDLEPVS